MIQSAIIRQEDDMKKPLLLIMALFATLLFAEPRSINSLQEEILNLARQRHELIGKNLEIRGRMLEIQKSCEGSKCAQGDLREKLRPQWTVLRRNQGEIRAISRAINEKKKTLAGLIKTRKMHGKDKKGDTPEDFTNLD